MTTDPNSRRGTRAVLLAVTATAGLLFAATLPTLADDAAPASGPPTVRALTDRGTTPDDVRAQLRLRLDGTGPTHVMNLNRGVDRLQLLELSFAPGQLVDWHTHPGPVVVLVDQGVLTVTSASDCVAREYGPDEAYIEQGRGDVLKVSNDTSEETVIYALFFELPETGPVTHLADDPGC